MRGQIQSGSRRLNRHWQSSEKRKRRIYTFSGGRSNFKNVVVLNINDACIINYDFRYEDYYDNINYSELYTEKYYVVSPDTLFNLPPLYETFSYHRGEKMHIKFDFSHLILRSPFGQYVYDDGFADSYHYEVNFYLQSRPLLYYMFEEQNCAQKGIIFDNVTHINGDNIYGYIPFDVVSGEITFEYNTDFSWSDEPSPYFFPSTSRAYIPGTVILSPYYNVLPIYSTTITQYGNYGADVININHRIQRGAFEPMENGSWGYSETFYPEVFLTK